MTLTLHLTLGRITSATLDVNPLVAVPAPLGGTGGVSLPGVMLYKPPHAGPAVPFRAITRHELHHYRQEAALGPWFWVAYALTGGRAFEPTQQYGVVAKQSWTDAWKPPPSDEDNFPLFRVRWNDGLSLSVLPGYPGIAF
ncbi:MAG TPA: hypothetical protein VKA00_00685 [Trueperaceae bacterium]|nr:hypothetical protein [Trueperaceae bacterium]